MKWKVLGALVAVHVLGVTAAHAVTLSTTYIGEGSINPPVGVHSFGWGSKVTITATPVEDWVFDHWEGDLSGSSNPKSLRMWGNRRVTAAFRPITPTPANALAGVGLECYIN